MPLCWDKPTIMANCSTSCLVAMDAMADVQQWKWLLFPFHYDLWNWPLYDGSLHYKCKSVRQTSASLPKYQSARKVFTISWDNNFSVKKQDPYIFVNILLDHCVVCSVGNILLLQAEIARPAFSPVNINTLLLTHSKAASVTVSCLSCLRRKFARENFIDKTRAGVRCEVRYKMETIRNIML